MNANFLLDRILTYALAAVLAYITGRAYYHYLKDGGRWW